MRTFLRYLMVVEFAVNALLLSDLAAGQETLVSFEQEIQAALSNRVYGAENAVGIVVGILTPEGRQFLFDGLADRESGEAPGPRTMFRIGFTTSLFSSLLLSDMVVQGELSLDDPISDYLQASVQPPAFDGREITLADLATGTSGLPIRPLSYRGPPFGIRVQDLYDSLSSFSPSRAPAEMYEASIFDEALLVAILSRAPEWTMRNSCVQGSSTCWAWRARRTSHPRSKAGASLRRTMLI